jgi:hypothetical protein
MKLQDGTEWILLGNRRVTSGKVYFLTLLDLNNQSDIKEVKENLLQSVKETKKKFLILSFLKENNGGRR